MAIFIMSDKRAKVLEVPKALAEAAVVATNQITIYLTTMETFILRSFLLPLTIFISCMTATIAAVLPAERADAMYHRYDGGGMVIDGPSILLRKNIAEKYSIAANYYVDSVSSASIDVQTSGASEYTEERKESSLDFTYLEDKSLINIGYTSSKENDYEANSFRIDFSQDFFGDMSTLSMGFSQGNDDITQTDNDGFAEKLERRHYRVGLAQILTRNLMANINYESIIDEGYLQNPYRFVLVNNGTAYDIQAERYPNTRNSDAISFKLSYHLPWPAAVKSRFGYFTDSWGIKSQSVEFDYSQKINNRLIVDLRIRQYQQGNADFYANAFNTDSILQTFVGRDKELSEYSSFSLGVGASYEWTFKQRIDKATANIQLDYMVFDYDNFNEVTSATTARFGIGNEPLYSFNAYALRLFFSLWY
jgi:hypothetical protein